MAGTSKAGKAITAFELYLFISFMYSLLLRVITFRIYLAALKLVLVYLHGEVIISKLFGSLL